MWSHEQLTKLGYHLHADGQYHPHPPPPRLLDPVPQCDPLQPLVPSSQTQKTSSFSITLRINRTATKLQDFDNFVGGTKPLTDQLRYAGILPDDDPASITSEFIQSKCKHKHEEGTTVQIVFTPKTKSQTNSTQRLNSIASNSPAKSAET